MEILDEIKRKYIQDLIRRGKRPEERGFCEYRKIRVEKNILSSAEGSAKVWFGNTQVLVGIKLDVGTPFQDRPEEGVLSTNAELLPLASPTFESGPPDERAIELARVVDRGIRSSGAVDLKKLYIEENKVWALFIDIYVLDYDGNLIDASALAAMCALLNTKLPKFEDGKVIRENIGKLEVENKTITCTFAKIDSQTILDPCLDEEKAMSSRISIATTPTHVCAIQKGGRGWFTESEILDLIDLSFDKGNELRKMIS